MALFPVTLRWVAFAFVALFTLAGLALAIAGIAILTRVQVVGGIAAMFAGSALAVYGIRLGVHAHSGQFPEWLRDIRSSAPLRSRRQGVAHPVEEPAQQGFAAEPRVVRWLRQSAGREATVPRTPMTSHEATRLLEDGQLVRVAFRHGDAPYLIPLGYTWLGSALYGVADRGLKTELAERNPTVAFQVDTALDTGLFEWESVTGTGRFAIVTDGDEARRALAALQPFVAEAPDWWRAEQGPRMAAGALIVWRIEPDSFTGVRYAPRETP